MGVSANNGNTDDGDNGVFHSGSKGSNEPALKKRVYLFELDSVRMTDVDIIAGQWALYREIVVNGNVVVLTFNQLVDSRGFLSLLTGPIPQSEQEERDLEKRRERDGEEEGDTRYGQALMKLFQSRAIRISQFGSLRTISQYLLNAIDDDKHFVYSALPLKYKQKRLTALVRRCLLYSDLSELHGYFSTEHEHDCSAALRRLFAEVDDSGNVTERCAAPGEEEKLMQQRQRILRNLYALLKTVIRLSTLDYIYINPRDPDEYRERTVIVDGREHHYCGLKLSDYLNAVIAPCQRDVQGKYACARRCEVMTCTQYPVDETLWKQACTILCSLEGVSGEVPGSAEHGETHTGRMFTNDNRSVYVRRLKESYEGYTGGSGVTAQSYRYAEAIVNLCYNYACEASIRNTSKHYNVAEIREGMPNKPTFVLDFCHRLEQDWGTDKGDSVFNGNIYLAHQRKPRYIDREERYLKDETNEFISFDVERYRKVLPDFSEAGRMAAYGDYAEDARREKQDLLAASVCDINSDGTMTEAVAPAYAYEHAGIERYEERLDEQRKTHRKRMTRSVGKKIAFALLCVLLACGIEVGMNTLEGFIVSTNGPIWLEHLLRNDITGTIIFLFVAEYLTGLLTRPFPWMMSLSEALGNMFAYCRDFALMHRREETYVTSSAYCKDVRDTACDYRTEPFNKARPIDFVLSRGLRRYLRLFRKQFEQQLRGAHSAEHADDRNHDVAQTGFPEAPSVPETLVVARVDDRAVQKALVDQEELFGYRFGIVYASAFNRMIVDPIVRDGDLPMIVDEGSARTARFYPYERVMPSHGDGVVMVVKKGERFVLLNQYRHAIRRDELGFPRGYAEPNQTPVQNACRELNEELGVEVREEDLVPLGRVAPDSGLTGGVVHVFLVNIDHYDVRKQYEGIVDVQELTSAEIKEYIMHSGKLEDGYTISAYCLYCLHQWSERSVAIGCGETKEARNG